jgi:hypothetical protein
VLGRGERRVREREEVEKKRVKKGVREGRVRVK